MSLRLASDRTSHFFMTLLSAVSVSLSVTFCFGLFTPPCRWLVGSQSATADPVWWREGEGYFIVKANLSPCRLHWSRNNPLIWWEKFSLSPVCDTGLQLVIDVCVARAGHAALKEVQVLWLVQCCRRSGVCSKMQYQTLVSGVSFLLLKGSAHELFLLSFFN